VLAGRIIDADVSSGEVVGAHVVPH
jgi:hypothetical protein